METSKPEEFRALLTAYDAGSITESELEGRLLEIVLERPFGFMSVCGTPEGEKKLAARNAEGIANVARLRAALDADAADAAIVREYPDPTPPPGPSVTLDLGPDPVAAAVEREPDDADLLPCPADCPEAEGTKTGCFLQRAEETELCVWRSVFTKVALRVRNTPPVPRAGPDGEPSRS